MSSTTIIMYRRERISERNSEWASQIGPTIFWHGT